ncbi:conserved leucine-rich repeat protein [Drechmeria coniospora]|uniref:Conserved leucine-rich repeat protein n=1 Tax=Drechmeria coniospora TaxID=98403 RepID=A0A151GGI5_DRECN|nr:conserved leucine-rich repeat protein [Drechmeria coniospora]KYK56217.1 conserved leucine-rich repeat protein [Drechmeria coniospora]
MDHAWLDSLSEDWVSERGDSSADKLPPLEFSDPIESTPSRQRQSRIPRRTPKSKASTSSTPSSSPYVLGERSANDINISSRRLRSALSREIKLDEPGQSMPTTANGSVIRNSSHHRVSSSRGRETPEWKRRLVQGKLAYGEQRDLFSSAAAGLQDMFKPPPAADGTVGHADATLPSSPPIDALTDDLADLERYIDVDDDEDSREIVSPSPSPRRRQRGVQYLPNDESISSPSQVNGARRGSDSSRQQPRDRPGARRVDGPLTVPHDTAATSRKTSGRSDTRNEEFSPIMIGKHSTEGGKVDFAHIEVPVEQLWQKLERLRINQMLSDESRADVDNAFSNGPDALDEESLVHAETSNEYPRKEAVANLQLDGPSRGDSFRHGGLPSDIGVDSSEMLPEESLQASTPKQFPSVSVQGRTAAPTLHLSPSPALPRAPFPSPEKRQARESHKANGSPLKLFGPYDTFTNQTLLRRISQFEDASGGTSRQSSHAIEVQNSPPSQHRPNLDALPNSTAISRFGGGDLDGYEFPGDVSYESTGNWEAVDKENVEPTSPLRTRPSFNPLQGQSPNNDADLYVRRRRNTGSTQTRSSISIPSNHHHHQAIALPNNAPLPALTPKRDGDSEGKRPRTSPSKDPTPKRRRTLHRSDVAFGREDRLATLDSAHRQMQVAISKKRKDARPGKSEMADASLLAMRSMLWPQNSTPASRQTPSPVHLQIRAIQNENGSRHDDVSETERKPSIITQDFIDQAAQIMAMIRNQVRPRLASLEESENEGGEARHQHMMDDSSDESTDEPFSRPPSREGNRWTNVAPSRHDPEIISRLKKYQERSDVDDIHSSSLRPMGRPSDDDLDDGEQSVQNYQVHGGALHVTDDIVSDLPNVRITSAGGQDSGLWSPGKDFPSNASSRSFSRNYPTTSSRGSEYRRTIMPESVSHLIPDRVGGMFLDRQNKIWVRRKGSGSTAVSDVPPPAEDTEDDPFASISDLSVDMTRELQNLKVGVAKGVPAGEAELHSVSQSTSGAARRPSRRYTTLSPKDRPGPHMAALAREELFKLGDRASTTSKMSPGAERDTSPRDVNTNAASSSARRRLTISFSSPVASVIHDVVTDDLDPLDFGDDDDNSQPGLVKTARRNSLQVSTRTGSYGQGRLSSARGPEFVPRPVSRIDEQDEESTVEIQADEDRQISIIGDNSVVSHRTPHVRHASLNFVIGHSPNSVGPLSFQPEESAIIGRNVGKLSLSPLSEFTVNNADQSFGFEVSYVMGHRRMATGDGSKKVMSMTIRDLVDKLSEVEPFEPFWEDMTELDLQDKQLASLHMLDEFCGRVVTLDASKNKLNHLEGLPSSVRQLKVAQNMLTELTSWDHLLNLQYVDISGNEIKSLSALKNLVHLRSVRADDNQLTGLDGLDCHDGLLSLRARNNLIEHVDFSTAMFERLTELDLEGNSIVSVQNLELLPALSRLGLKRNRLRDLTLKAEMRTLRQLDVSDNELESLDLSNLPSIRCVYADRNRLCELSGFERARRLDSLSIREQHGDSPLNLGFLSHVYEVRKLFLSGNFLESFEPTVDFLNLQLLDLANCGLRVLPAKMGQLMPNLRTLNVNFNALGDLTPLQFVPRLKKLLVAGNRLADSTGVTRLLTEFPHLSQLDARDNPVTLGFYAPVQVLVPAGRAEFSDPFTLPDADEERDGLFASRLDEATRLRRRLHQVVLVASCRRLRKLDGLPVRRREVLATDDVLRTLVSEGVVPDLEDAMVGRSEKVCDDDGDGDGAAARNDDAAADAEAAAQLESELEASRQQNETLGSSRWNAEDSFA